MGRGGLKIALQLFVEFAFDLPACEASDAIPVAIFVNQFMLRPRTVELIRLLRLKNACDRAYLALPILGFRDRDQRPFAVSR